METWLIFAILSLIFAGLYNFMFKIVAVNNYNTLFINKASYLILLILSIIFLLFTVKDYSLGNIGLLVILSFFASSVFSLSIFSRVKSMQNIDSVIFFPLYKTFGPIVMTLISIYFFKETINLKEFIGIVVGICVPLLLINKKENMIQKNLFVGIIFLLITVFFSSISSAINKQVIVLEYDVAFYMIFIGFFGFLFSFLTFLYNGKNNHKYKKEGSIKLSIITGFLYFGSFYCFIRALEGNLAIVFTINSFSILIPIILSILFYKEHFNLRKLIVILLSIVSILLFI